MDGHIFQYSSDLQLLSSDAQGTHSRVPYLAENTFSQQHLVKPEDHNNYTLPQLIGYPQLAPNYVDYLLGNGISKMQREVPYESAGIGCSFTPNEYFLSVDAAHQTEPYPYQVPNEVVQHQPNVAASTSDVPTKSRKTCARKKASVIDRRRRTRIAAALDALGHLLPQSEEVVTLIAKRQGGTCTNRVCPTAKCYVPYCLRLDTKPLLSRRSHRKQPLYSHGVEGSKANVIDDCIDYIKYLQRHMRELSQNRLKEPTSNCLLYLEGCGTYLVHENAATGPLQDMLGKLLDENPSEATKFLESQDLFVMPIAPN